MCENHQTPSPSPSDRGRPPSGPQMCPQPAPRLAFRHQSRRRSRSWRRPQMRRLVITVRECSKEDYDCVKIGQQANSIGFGHLYQSMDDAPCINTLIGTFHSYIKSFIRFLKYYNTAFGSALIIYSLDHLLAPGVPWACGTQGTSPHEGRRTAQVFVFELLAHVGLLYGGSWDLLGHLGLARFHLSNVVPFSF